MGRITADKKQKMTEIQEEIRASLSVPLVPTAKYQNRLLDAIVKYEHSLPKMGNLGQVLTNLATRILVNHPDAPEVFQHSDWNEFENKAIAVLENPSKDAADQLVNVYKPLVRHISFLKPRLDLARDNVRKEKNIARNVGMKLAYMLGENGFYGKADDFRMFSRNSEVHLNEVLSLQEQQKVFTSHNMPEVAHAVGNRIKLLQELHTESYLGFHRLSPLDASLVCARATDLKWHEQHFLTVPFKFFDQRYWHEVPEKKEEDRQKEDMKKLLVMKDHRTALMESTAFAYQPRLYPLGKFHETPSTTADIISRVENMQELGGCPVFDYYWVLVPSINVNHPHFRTKDTWRLLLGEENIVCQDEYAAALALDIALVRDGYFMPVVLGERDGKCYFLCFWM
jgi:hypothetical protein